MKFKEAKGDKYSNIFREGLPEKDKKVLGDAIFCFNKIIELKPDEKYEIAFKDKKRVFKRIK